MAEHPLRERLWGQLMLALHHSGRSSEALAAYRDLQRILHDEVGIEPSRPIQDLHHAILTDEPQLALLPVATPEPRESHDAAPRASGNDRPLNELPLDVQHFTGRRREVAALTATLVRTRHSSAVAMVFGKAGVGKTALAVHVAHRLRGAFPDGQLFLHLGDGPHREPSAPSSRATPSLRVISIACADQEVSRSLLASGWQLTGAAVNGKRILALAQIPW